MSWPVRNFSEAISSSGIFTDGDWVESKDQDPRGDVRLIQLADIGVGKFIDKSDRFMSSAKAKELRCTFLEAGDILIARMPDPIGRACIFPENMGKCVTVVDVCVIRPDSDDIDTKWLMHQINSEKFKNQINQHVTGTTRQRISRGNLAKLEISVPPLAEQKRIATILDKADAIRRKRQQAIQLADDFLRATFLDMFGDPATNPKGWELKSLGELFKLSSGKGLSAKDMSAGAYPVYGGNGINGMHSEYLFEEPQLVIGRVGAYCGVIHITKEKSWITDNALYVREYLQDVNIHYLAQLLEISNLNQYAGKAAQPLVSGSRIYPLKMIFPPLELQDQFQKVKEKFIASKSNISVSRDNSEKFFFSLSQKAFSGQL